MAEKYLIDTCIWRDFYEERFSKIGRPLGKYAGNLFQKILKNKDEIYYSDSLIWELKRRYSEEEIKDLLNVLFLTKTLIKIEIKKDEHLEAKKLAQERNIPYVDCLNAIHARNHHAVLVSQDPHIIKQLEDIAPAVRPEKIS
jgi:predicted nucleic acid-binding protein